MKTYYKTVGCPPNAVIISEDKTIKEVIEHAEPRIRIAKNELVGVISYIQQFEVFHNTEEAKKNLCYFDGSQCVETVVF